MDDLAYLEGLAGQALRLVDDDSKSVSMATIGRLLGLRIVRVSIGELPRGVLGSIYGSVVCVRTGLTPITERFVLGHEFGHHLGAVTELDADYVAAALVVPRRALRCAMHYFGRDFEALAGVFTASQTTIALRLGECGSVTAVAVVGPGIVRARASVEFEFPDESTLRKLASSDRVFTGIKRETLTDDVRRVALMVEEGE